MSKPLAAAGERMPMTVLCLQSSLIFRISLCSASSPPYREAIHSFLPNHNGNGRECVAYRTFLFDEEAIMHLGDTVRGGIT
ncbi:hypothetical protein TNCT_311141 [Trichonephila clavata]|uniref:Uncharacterized protein n=1 Tax=Trichonephila clavata TaxID=2740835 RepID=A0A8X6LLH8_TRICU|nr:hypothetical protein TNCT_311141 [Trichonephila clavata]